MGKFWHSTAPWKVKRMMFMIKIFSAAISGLESYCLKSEDVQTLDKKLTGLLRSMMKGNACRIGGDKYKALPSKSVWKYWKLATTSI